MSGKSILYTAVISLAVVIGYETYKGGGARGVTTLRRAA